MTVDQLYGYVLIASTLIGMGMTVAGQIRTIFTAAGLTEAEQDQIIATLQDDNARRRAISAAIAGVN